VYNFWITFYRNTFSQNTVLTSLLVCIIVVVSGPFGTYEAFTLVGRAIYWTPLIVLALAVSGISCLVAQHWFPKQVHVEHAVLAAGFFFLIYTPVMLIVTGSGVFGRLPEPVSGLHVLAAVAAFSIVLGIWSMVFGTAHLQTAASAVARPRLYMRLPEAGEQWIVRITVQDHYVEVRLSDGGAHRLLMRFKDAVREMDDADGFCVHRSHWVARDAVQSAVKDGPKEFVVMTTGDRIPISKTYRANVVLAGFL